MKYWRTLIIGILSSGWLIAHIIGYWEYNWYSVFVPSICVLILSFRIEYVEALKE